jgi:SAM-dependent methyltransferase
VAFEGTDQAYDGFMGRFSRRLAPLFADFAGVGDGLRVVDVGCGPGALTGVLVARTGAGNVAAADPTEQFVASCRARFPGVDVVEAPAEALPYAADAFDAALAQLVVAFMEDADAGVGEMARVARRGGVVAACMWLTDGDMQLLHALDVAASAVAPDHPATRRVRRYRTEAEGRELFERAGLDAVETSILEVTAAYESADDLAGPILAGSGPIAPLVAELDEGGRLAFRAALLGAVGDPDGPFTLTGRAWAARGRVG